MALLLAFIFIPRNTPPPKTPTLTASPIFTATATPVSACRPPGNQPPNIYLNIVPKAVKINLTAELSITVDDYEDDTFEVLAITAEKGLFPNGRDKPYKYEAPNFSGDDIVTVFVRDHNCTSKEEIKIVIVP